MTTKGPYQDPLKYLRRRGNRRVRARRRRRSALRVGLIAAAWTAATVGLLALVAVGLRWATAPGRFPLAKVAFHGNLEASDAELQSLVESWHGKNLLTVSLAGMERKLREHPWIGQTGTVRIGRRISGEVAVTIEERVASAFALVDGHVVILDALGAPIDRFGPRYAEYDFPIITGLERLVERSRSGSSDELRAALRTGVSVIDTLSRERPALYASISEIDVADATMIGLKVEGQSYALRLSTEEYVRNLDNLDLLEKRLAAAAGELDYVDLRWQGRIAVSPAAALMVQDGGE